MDFQKEYVSDPHVRSVKSADTSQTLPTYEEAEREEVTGFRPLPSEVGFRDEKDVETGLVNECTLFICDIIEQTYGVTRANDVGRFT